MQACFSASNVGTIVSTQRSGPIKYATVNWLKCMALPLSHFSYADSAKDKDGSA